jgi:hypothetical protein
VRSGVCVLNNRFLSKQTETGCDAALMGIPMMSISHSDLMPIRSERSDAGLSQCETVIDIRQEFWFFSLS